MDFSVAWDSVQDLANGFMAMLPRVLVGMAILVVAIVIGHGVRSAVRRAAARRRERASLQLALGRLAMAGVVAIGGLVAATAAFPGFTPSDLVGALGIGGVAIGFAFRDIFQNFLAGVLILATKPFVVGDQIRFEEFEGNVEEIHTRATYLRTYDGRRVVIPNGELFTRSVVVNTAFRQRRMEYDIGIGMRDDIELARRIILETLVAAEGVSPDPKADVIVVDIRDSSIRLRARWWSESHIADVLIAQDKVLTAVVQRLQAAGIDMPHPTHQVLFHDQTEATDGDRRRQRDGWPAGPGDVPRPRPIAVARTDGANDGSGPAAS